MSWCRPRCVIFASTRRSVRICFVSRRYFPAISGMSVYAENLLHRLVAGGHDVTMISQYRGDAFGAAVYGGGPPPPVPGVRVIGREQRGEQDGGDFERDVEDLVATILDEHARSPFDVLHAQYGYPPGYAVLRASAQTGVPSVTSIQGGDGHWVGSCCATHDTAMRTVIEESGAVLIGGASFRDEVCERLDVDPRLFTIVPGAVDTERFVPAPRPASDSGIPAVLYHGRVDRRKGALDFIEALRRIGARSPFRAIVSGIGPDVDAVRRAIDDAALAERVEMRGYVAYADAPGIYRGADIFASPTYGEGFSNTVLEAMACGLPIVSCRAVGVVDCLRNGDNALLVEPGDVDGLAAALLRLCTDVRLRVRLARTALEECRRTYSWFAVADRIVAVYHELILRGPAPAVTLPEIAIEACRFRGTPHLL